jgi:hypothetical protein
MMNLLNKNLKFISSQKVLKFPQKNFFEKFYKKEKFYVQPKNINIDDMSYHEPSQPILFQNNKYNILTSQENTKIANVIQYGLIYPITLLSGYKLITSIFKFKIIGSLMWGAIFVYISRLSRGFGQNKYFMIKRIDLLDDGRTIEVFTYANKFKADIASIRKVTAEEAMYYAGLIGGTDYIPIIIRDEIFIIARSSEINDQEVFSAITGGSYIKLTKDKTVDKEDIIDIN